MDERKVKNNNLALYIIEKICLLASNSSPIPRYLYDDDILNTNTLIVMFAFANREEPVGKLNVRDLSSVSDFAIEVLAEKLFEVDQENFSLEDDPEKPNLDNVTDEISELFYYIERDNLEQISSIWSDARLDICPVEIKETYSHFCNHFKSELTRGFR